MNLFKSVLIFFFCLIINSAAHSACKTYKHGCCGVHPNKYDNCCGGCCTDPSNDCEGLFADGIQIHSTLDSKKHKITFGCNARLINNPDNILESKNSIAFGLGGGEHHCPNTPDTCADAHCVASGNPAKKIDACRFLFRTGGRDVVVKKNQTNTLGMVNYKDITVQINGTLNFKYKGENTEYRIKKLKLNNDTVVNFTPGNYWIEEFQTGKNVKVNVIGDGTARIFIRKNTKFGKDGRFNADSTEPNPSKKLLMYGYKNIEIEKGSVFYGFIYSKGKITLKRNVGLVGAILGQSVSLKKGATVTYDPDAVDALDMGFLCPPVTHFELDHLNEGIKCFKHNVTVTVKKGTKTVTNYTKKVVLDTGTGMGTWFLVNGNGTFNDATLDDGLAEYTFSDSDNGVAEFQLLYAGGVGPATIDVEVYQKSKPDIRDDDKSGIITFYLWGYVITAEPFNAAEDPQAQLYNEVQIAGVPDDMYITAYGQGSNQSVSSCSVQNEYTGNVTLKMWQDYVDPTSGTMTMSINGKSIGNSESSAVNVNVPFESGIALVSSVYKDVGKLKLFVKSEESINPGTTDNFVVKPAKLKLRVYDNPKASSSNGPVFRKAGENFKAEVEVLEIGGARVPNFGNEINPEKVEIFSSQLVAPVGGRNGINNDGLIGNGSNLVKKAPGKFESTELTFDEVGIIRLQAQIFGKDYLGAGNVLSLASDNVGRFIPYVFDATGNQPVFQTACMAGDFSYIGQPFVYYESPVIEIVAKSKANTITKNYFGSFWKLTGDGITQEFSSNAVAKLTNPKLNPQVVSNEDDINKRGTGIITYPSDSGFKFNKVDGKHLAPFEAEIKLESNIFDSDNVAYRDNPFTFGDVTVDNGIAFTQSNIFYQGRFNIKDNIGLETKIGKLQCMTEIFNGVSYIVNAADNCTVFENPEHLVLKTQPADLKTTASIVPIIDGECLVKLTPPPGGKTGERMNVTVTPQLQDGYYNIPWLQHDWRYDDSLDGKFDDNPYARYIFGYRSGSEGIIYTEEKLEKKKKKK